MIIPLKKTYRDKTLDGAFAVRGSYTGYGFDTETEQIVPISGNHVGTFLDPPPVDLDWPIDLAFNNTCDENRETNGNYTVREFYHVRQTGTSPATFRIVLVENSPFCGYAPPPPTCELIADSAQVSGRTATIPARGGRGVLQYRLDGSAVSQGSNVFRDLAPGEHVVLVVDAGLAGCQQEVRFTIAAPEQELSFPTGPAESLHHALRPIWEQVTGYSAGTLLRLELWVETLHLAGDYQLVYAAQKVVATAGVASFRLDGILKDLLETEAPSLLANATVLLRKPIRNFFCRTRPVAATTGELGVGQNRPLRTVLLAGLHMTGTFMTTQPLRRTMVQQQPEFLYYLAQTATQVRRVVVAGNGTRTTETEQVDAPAVAGWHLLQVRVYGLALPPDARQVEITMLDDLGNGISETRTYELEATVATRRVFLFASPAGGVDTLVTTGNLVATLEVKPDVAERAPEVTDGVRVALRQTWQLPAERTRQVATGWRTPDELRWLQCFALSWQVWEVVVGALQPVVVGKRTVVHSRDERKLEGLRFDYEYAAEETAWNQLR